MLNTVSPFEVANRLILARAVRGTSAICLVMFGFLAGCLWSKAGVGLLFSAHSLAMLLGAAVVYFGIIFFRSHRFIEAALVGETPAWAIIPEWLTILFTMGMSVLGMLPLV